MATLELAACLPVLVVVVAAVLSAIGVAGAQIRVQDAAREAARAASRGDVAIARRLADQAAPGARVVVRMSATDVIVRAQLRPRMLGSWLAPIDVSAQAVAAREP